MNKIDQALDALADRIIDDLKSGEVKLDIALEAFKILSGHQIGMAKLKKPGDDEADIPKFDSFRQRIQGATNG